MPPQDPRVDELRQQLRALGYLDAGVDRFVLGPAREARRPSAIALFASLRTGLIAAILLGPAAAIGLAGRLPGLVTGPRDAIVIALYLGALFGAGVAALAFVASLLFARLGAARVADRARRLSRTAGAVVTIGCLVYLTLWWHTANAGFGWAAPVWTVFALLVAVAISLLVGHAALVTTLAVMMAAQPEGASAPARSAGLSWGATIGIAALAFAGAAVLLTSTGTLLTRDAPVPPALTVVSSGLRVRVIAIDGFDPGVFDQLTAAGRMPALDAAFRVARARLAIDSTRDPARAWTTIATGQPADVHGVRGLETTRVAGLQGAIPAGPASPLARAVRAATDLLRLTHPSIASGSQRRQKTMWEVASDAGLRTAVVNWWATWPAPADSSGDRGIVLSDRATLRLERGGPLDAEISPSALYETLRPQWTAVRQRAAARVAVALELPEELDPSVAAILRRSAEIDAIQAVLADLVATPTTDLMAVYLPGLDIAQHALLATGEGALGASATVARVDALRDYYVFLDRLVAPLLAAGKGQLVVLVTEPGRVASTSEGLLAMVGTGVRNGAGDANSTDVMPTVLHALGVPVSDQLAGTPLTRLFEEAFVARYPVRRTSTYGAPSTATGDRKGQPLDAEMIDRLRSLGYVR
jgi:type I phosphodiesterase/nucleotide pyrophosphatase